MTDRILLLIGSLGFLLYGMKLMSDGVQKSAGGHLKKALGFMTGNRIIGLFTGIFITMIIQSSGATTVMVVSFVNAGLITLTQSVGVIFGANIGTTVTAWIVSIFGFNFKISSFAVPLFGLGFFMTFVKKNGLKNLGIAVMGFGLLFLGLGGLSDCFTFNAENLDFLVKFQKPGVFTILLSFGIGIIITALMHSSSAFSAIVITMAYNKIIIWEVAAAMTLGSNIGSTIDAILAALGSTSDSKRAAFIHVFFNVAGNVIALIFFKPFLKLVLFLTPSTNIAIQISMLHTVFKTISTIIFIPFVNQIVKLAQLVIKDDKSNSAKEYHLDFHEIGTGKESSAAHILRVEKEITNMTDVVSQMFDRMQIGFSERNEEFVKVQMPYLEEEENYCDQMHEQIINYIIHCEQLSITEDERAGLSNMIQIIDDLESMSDECFAAGKLIQKSVDKGMEFKTEDTDRLIPYVELARQFLQFIHININKPLPPEKLEFATSLENEIDAQRKHLKKVARKRLEKGADVKAELLYIDLVRQIEKIGDHAFSISEVLSNTK